MELTAALIRTVNTPPARRVEHSILTRDASGKWHEQVQYMGDIYECLTHDTIGEC